MISHHIGLTRICSDPEMEETTARTHINIAFLLYFLNNRPRDYRHFHEALSVHSPLGVVSVIHHHGAIFTYHSESIRLGPFGKGIAHPRVGSQKVSG